MQLPTTEYLREPRPRRGPLCRQASRSVLALNTGTAGWSPPEFGRAARKPPPTAPPMRTGQELSPPARHFLLSVQSAIAITTAASAGSKLASRSANFAVACSGIFSSFTFTTLVEEPRWIL